MSGAELHGFRRVVRAIRPFLIGLLVAGVASILGYLTLNQGVTGWPIVLGVTVILSVAAVANLGRKITGIISAMRFHIRYRALLKAERRLGWYLDEYYYFVPSDEPESDEEVVETEGPVLSDIRLFEEAEDDLRRALDLVDELLHSRKLRDTQDAIEHLRDEVDHARGILRRYCSGNALKMLQGKRHHGAVEDIIYLGGISLIVLTVPILTIYWAFSLDLSWAIQIGVLFLSLGISMTYMVTHIDRFPSPASKVSFIAGICTGSVLVFQVLLRVMPT